MKLITKDTAAQTSRIYIVRSSKASTTSSMKVFGGLASNSFLPYYAHLAGIDDSVIPVLALV